MKRFVAVMILMVLMTVSASADIGIDLDSLSDYELFELQLAVQEKIFSIDPAAGFIMYPGRSIVGKTFDEGSYIVKVIDPIDNGTGLPPFITVWKNEKVMGSIMTKDIADSQTFRQGDETFQINLAKGMCFELHNGVYQFIKR